MTDNHAASDASRYPSEQLSAEQVLMAEKLCETAAIPAGARVLDIGTAGGHSVLHAAIAAARRRAVVTAIHMKEPVLERARARAAFEGFDTIDYSLADAAAMPFADGAFDVAVSTLGLVFVHDQAAAAAELARVVRPGGTIALTAFTPASLPSRVYDMFGALLPNAPRPSHHHYEWSDGARAGALLRPWFADVRVTYDSYDSCFCSAPEAFEVTAAANPNIQALLARVTPELAAQIRQGFIAIAESCNRATDGSHIGRMDYAVITAVRTR